MTNLEPGGFAQVTVKGKPSTTAYERRTMNVSKLNYTKDDSGRYKEKSQADLLHAQMSSQRRAQGALTSPFLIYGKDTARL